MGGYSSQSHRNRFSRGGAWGLDLVLHHAADLDAAVLIAAYPHSNNDAASVEESRRLMRVPRPILLIHYALDLWTNSISYPRWLAGFYHGMHELRVSHTFEPGFRHLLFSSIVVAGNHDDGQNLQLSLDLKSLGNHEALAWWTCMCAST